jgi:hypothetical protein
MAWGNSSRKAFVEEFEGKPDPSDKEVDQAWCSELCKRKISNAVLTRYPCKQKFSQVDVIPLYACGPQRFYRVTLWVNDWSTESFGPITVIWQTFYVTLEGIERTIVSIEEDRKKKLGMGEKGLEFMKELGIDKGKV